MLFRSPDLRTLQAVLGADGRLDANEVNQVLNSIGQDTGAQRVGLGIKTVLEALEESRAEAARGGPPIAESFADRLVGYINAEAVDM